MQSTKHLESSSDDMEEIPTVNIRVDKEEEKDIVDTIEAVSSIERITTEEEKELEKCEEELDEDFQNFVDERNDIHRDKILLKDTLLKFDEYIAITNEKDKRNEEKIFEMEELLNQKTEQLRIFCMQVNVLEAESERQLIEHRAKVSVLKLDYSRVVTISQQLRNMLKYAANTAEYEDKNLLLSNIEHNVQEAHDVIREATRSRNSYKRKYETLLETHEDQRILYDLQDDTKNYLKELERHEDPDHLEKKAKFMLTRIIAYEDRVYGAEARCHSQMNDNEKLNRAMHNDRSKPIHAPQEHCMICEKYRQHRERIINTRRVEDGQKAKIERNKMVAMSNSKDIRINLNNQFEKE
ncbi:GRIP domain-containing protein RUD3-like [Anneissia japonica]|uniref:GRIP domain-containing protein RUD3-like n=1 Tax=Anneissia japonica TaxID=1529436 RepID=UPI00142591E1|nr:GRIP domain-containing protein RUD3-like [Anneissia japonica]